MKKFIVAVLLLCCSSAYALDTLRGHKIEFKKSELPDTIELVKNSRTHEYGVSFINDKGDRILLPYGMASIQTCGEYKKAAIVYSKIMLSPHDTSLFNVCKRPSYITIWDTNNEYATYEVYTGDL